MKKDLVPVDMDLIASLRLQHKYIEANELLRAYHESLKNNWKEGKRQNKLLADRIKKWLKRFEKCHPKKD